MFTRTSLFWQQVVFSAHSQLHSNKLESSNYIPGKTNGNEFIKKLSKREQNNGFIYYLQREAVITG